MKNYLHNLYVGYGIQITANPKLLMFDKCVVGLMTKLPNE
jgi:hypothetical protein